jgi:hypothetical protein
LVIKAQHSNLVTGLIDHLIPKGIVILQYADDTILCLQDNTEKARNIKLLLYIYEQMSGLKTNFDKSDIILVGRDNNLAAIYAEIFNCQVSIFPIKYLGVPVSASKLHISDWVKLEEKLEKKLDIWQGSSLSIGGRSNGPP